MNSDAVIRMFRETGALLEGHFLLSSGRHGRQFLQAARVLQYPRHAETLCAAMADSFRDQAVDLVAGPAMGGIVLAYETARQLGARAAFTEKGPHGGMALKRGFAPPVDARVLVVEDVTTTGRSVKKTIAHIRERGGNVIGLAALIDRSDGQAAFDCPFKPLARIAMETWDPAACPFCKEGRPLTDPDDIQAAP